MFCFKKNKSLPTDFERSNTLLNALYSLRVFIFDEQLNKKELSIEATFLLFRSSCFLSNHGDIKSIIYWHVQPNLQILGMR